MQTIALIFYFSISLPKADNSLGKKVDKVLNEPNLVVDKSFDESSFQQSQIQQSTQQQTQSTPAKNRKDRKRKGSDKKKKSKKSKKRPILSSDDSFVSESDSDRSSFTSDSYDSR